MGLPGEKSQVDTGKDNGFPKAAALLVMRERGGKRALREPRQCKEDSGSTEKAFTGQIWKTGARRQCWRKGVRPGRPDRGGEHGSSCCGLFTETRGEERQAGSTLTPRGHV